MDDEQGQVPAGRFPTEVERTGPCQMTVRRVFDAPARLVFAAWTRPELMMRWWVPRSIGIVLSACRIDARTGGSYRFEFDVGQGETMAFFGRYLDVIPDRLLVWTNEESADGAVTKVIFEEVDGRTHLVLEETYPTEAALNEALAGSAQGLPEQFAQLDEIL